MQREMDALNEFNTRREELSIIVNGELPYTQSSVQKHYESYNGSTWYEHISFIDRFLCMGYPLSFSKDIFTQPFKFLFSDQFILDEDDLIKFHIQLVYTQLQLLWVEFLRKYVTDYKDLQKEFLSTLTDILRAVQFNESVISTALQKAIFCKPLILQKNLKFMEEYIIHVNAERLKREAGLIKEIDINNLFSIFYLNTTGSYRDYTCNLLFHLKESVNRNREEIRKILGINPDA